MENVENLVKVKAKYRHFKGKDYIVEYIASDCDTLEAVVVYRQLYGDTNKVWVRKLTEFIKEIPPREDNLTGQKHRFELIEENNT